jgi:hypothetical protein
LDIIATSSILLRPILLTNIFTRHFRYMYDLGGFPFELQCIYVVINLVKSVFLLETDLLTLGRSFWQEDVS